MSATLIANVRRVLAVARFRAFDTSTEDGRASERLRRVLLTAVAFGFSKVVSMATMFVSYPLTLHYLGEERFGLWVTLSSLVVLLAFADFGIGNGLLNTVAKANGQDDTLGIRRAVSSGFTILGALGILILASFFAVHRWIAWPDVFNVTSPTARAECGTAMLVLICCFAINIPAGVVQRTQLGLQMGFISNLWLAAGSVLALGSVLVVIKLELGLPWLVGAVAGVPAVVSILNGLVFFTRHPEFAPARSLVSRETMRELAQSGLMFLVLQVAVSVAYTSDAIVISRVLGATEVPQYAVPDKLFSVIPLVLGMVLMPLWPAYGEAAARGDAAWVRAVFVRSLKIALLFAAVSAAVLVVSARTILMTWMGKNVDPPFMLLLGMGVWKLLEAWGIATAAFLNGTNTVRLQAILAILMAAAVIVLKVVFVHRYGVTGIIWATIIGYGLVSFLPTAYFIPKIFARFRSALTTPATRGRV